MVNCSVAIGDLVARSCSIIRAGASETANLRLLLPARSDMYVALTSVARNGLPSDAAYSM